MDRAIWAVTSALRKRAADLAPEGWPVLAFSMATRSVRVLWSAG